MEFLNKKLGARLFSVALILTFATNAVSQEEKESELSFFKKLSLQEEREYQELISKIKNANDSEYRGMLRDRVDRAYSKKEAQTSGFVIVEVTEEMRQPEPGFFAKLFTSPPTEEEYGVNKVEKLLSSGKGNGKSTGVGNGRQLKYQQKFMDSTKQRHFQQIDGTFSKSEAMSLLADQKIIDFHIADSEYQAQLPFIEIHSITGRILPPQKQKEYDEDFINEGVYQDLLKTFGDGSPSLVRVDFRRPESYINSTYSEQDKQNQLASVDNFIAEWSDYEYQILDKGEFHIYIELGKAQFEAMKGHAFIESFSSGNSLIFGSTRTD